MECPQEGASVGGGSWERWILREDCLGWGRLGHQGPEGGMTGLRSGQAPGGLSSHVHPTELGSIVGRWWKAGGFRVLEKTGKAAPCW